jgi:hypothetical protein
MKMFKKKDDGDKKPFSNSGKYGLGGAGMGASTVAKTIKNQGEMKSAPKKSAAPKPSVKSAPSSKASPKKTVKVMKSKLTSTPRVKATIQESRVNSRTGAVKKYPAKEMKMKSISEKEFSESKPKMQKTPWILKQTTGLDSMPSLEGKSKQYRDSVTMETYKKGGYRIK